MVRFAIRWSGYRKEVLMFRKKEEKIGSVVGQFLREASLETPLLQHRLMEAWPTVVGGNIAHRSTVVRIYDQKLWVKVDTPALRTQLQMMRQQLVQRLNAQVGSQLIYDVVFY